MQINREIKREEQGNHPTPKPVELIERVLKNSSRGGAVGVGCFRGFWIYFNSLRKTQQKMPNYGT
jgi:hypothetical protein